MTGRIGLAIRQIFRLASLYIAAGCFGFGLLILAFKAGLLSQIDILFYRGLLLVGVAFLATFALLAIVLVALRAGDLKIRDAFAASVLSLSLNICFLVVVPVTVDRSISIFVLGQMAAHPDETFTPDEMKALFTKVYVSDHRQIDRRLSEQAISGNVVKVGEAYRISSRGRWVIAASRLVADLFDSHAGIIGPDPAALSNPARAAR